MAQGPRRSTGAQRQRSRRAGAALEALVRPFVFRKYLDYGAFAALRELHAQIRDRDQPVVERRPRTSAPTTSSSGAAASARSSSSCSSCRSCAAAATRAAHALDAGGAAALARARASLPHDTRRAARVEPTCSCAASSTASSTSTTQQTHVLPPTRRARRRWRARWAAAACRDARATLTAHRDARCRAFDASSSSAARSTTRRGARGYGCRTMPTRERADRADDVSSAPASQIRRPRRSGCAACCASRRCRSSRRAGARARTSSCRLQRCVPRRPLAAARRRARHGAGRALRALRSAARRDRRRSAYLALLIEHPARARRACCGCMAPRAGPRDYLTRHPVLLDELLDDARASTRATPDWPACGARRCARDSTDADGDQEAADGPAAPRPPRPGLPPAGRRTSTGQLTVEQLADHLSALADAMLGADARDAPGKPCRKRHAKTPRFAVIGLRQARRQGARLRVRPRPRLPLRRRRRTRAEVYRASRGGSSPG